MKIRLSGSTSLKTILCQGGSASPEDDVWLIAEGADIRWQISQRVEDNTFHLGLTHALRTTRSTLQYGCIPM